MKDLGQDLRFLFRQLRASPGYAVAVVLTLGLGIGANAALFSVVDGVLVRPLPFRDGDRLVHLRYGGPGPGPDTIRFSVPEVEDYRRLSETLAGLMEYHSMSFTLLGGEEPDQVFVGVVSAISVTSWESGRSSAGPFSPRTRSPGPRPSCSLATATGANASGVTRGSSAGSCG